MKNCNWIGTFGWFKKQHNRKAQAGKGVTKKQMREGAKVGSNPMADRIAELEAEGYTNHGTLDDGTGTVIMAKKPEGTP